MYGEIVEIAVEVRLETEKAYRIFDGKAECWIPKSQITDYCEENGKSPAYSSANGWPRKRG